MQTTQAKLETIRNRIRKKLSLYQELTANEENLLAEMHRQHLMKPKEEVLIDGTDIVVTKEHDIEMMLQGIKERGEVMSKYFRGPAGSKWIGSIDTITGSIWAKECGAAIGTKEFAAYAKKKLMDPDYKKFRADIT